MNTVSVRVHLRAGWELFKRRPVLLAGGFVIATAVSWGVSFLLDPSAEVVGTSAVVMGLISAVVGILVEIGLVTFALRAHDHIEHLSLKDLWNPKPFLWYLIGQVLVGLVVLAGLVLLIVPGVIASIAFLFTSYLIIDKGRGPIEAMKESYRMTKGHWMELFLLLLAIVGINLLGLLALVVGLVVTVPVSMLALVHAYRTLSSGAALEA